MVDFFRMVKKGEQIGKVSSARYSPRPEKNIGYLNGADRALGSGHRARGRGTLGRNSVEVVPKQFIDP
jgi:glycine cleavage system aminomethyltransferase T